MGKEFEVPIGLVTLQAYGIEVCLSELYKEMSSVISDLEDQLLPQFEGKPTHPGDFTIVIEIQFPRDENN